MSRAVGRRCVPAGIMAAVVVSACAAPLERPDPPGMPALTERVDDLVAPWVAANEFSGAIVMTRGGRVVYARGFGMANHASGVAFTPDTPADGGSLAKTFTAAGIWWLAHDGRLALDDTVQRHVPEYPHAHTTVRQLLAHSNGLPPHYEFFSEFFGPDEVQTTTAMLRIVAARAPQPSFPPGTRYEYSNLGFDAAALVIERVTGQSFGAFVQERFFSRHGMHSSFARPARFADFPGVRTVGYRWRDGAWQLHDSFDGEEFLGASNLFFSAADLARWGSANAAGSALPAPAFDSGQQQLEVGGHALQVTGLSWYCDQRKVRCNYTGHNAGFHGFVFWDRERYESIAFVSNSSLPAWKIASLQRELVNALAGRARDDDPPAEFVDALDTSPADLAGIYVARDVPRMTLGAMPGGGMSLRLAAGLEYGAYPAGQQVLYVPGLDFYLAFSGSGAARAMHVKSQELDVVMRRTAIVQDAR